MFCNKDQLYARYLKKNINNSTQSIVFNRLYYFCLESQNQPESSIQIITNSKDEIIILRNSSLNNLPKFLNVIKELHVMCIFKIVNHENGLSGATVKIEPRSRKL